MFEMMGRLFCISTAMILAFYVPAMAEPTSTPALAVVLAEAAKPAVSGSQAGSAPALDHLSTRPGTTGIEASPKRWAIVSSPAVQGSGLSDLVAADLSKLPGIQLVERDRIDAVLRELTLSQFLGAEAIEARLKLGKLVGADVLVFLRERESEDKEQTAIEMAVARSDQGVRLLMHHVLWEPSKLKEVAAALLEELRHAKSLCERDDLQLFAVPPFASEDVGLRHEEKRLGYARFVEHLLTRHDGVAVVELGEAKALTRESAIAGTPVKRSLPFYVLGSYKTAGAWDNITVAFTLELNRVGTRLMVAQRDAVRQQEAPQALEQAMQDLLAKLGKRPQARPSPPVEAQLLVARADVFARIGDWDQAIPLYESALLCNPGHPAALFGLFDGYSRLAVIGGFGPPPVRMLSYSPRGRMEAAELALTQFTCLIAKYPASYQTLSPLETFVLVFHLRDYDIISDWDNALPAYRRASQLLDDALLNVIENPQGRHRIDGRKAREEATWMVKAVCEFYPVDPQEAFRRIARLLQVLDKQGDRANGVCAQLHAVVTIGQSAGQASQAYREFLGGLEGSPSDQIKFVAQVARILGSVRDEETKRLAAGKIDKLIKADPVRDAVRAQMPDYYLQQIRRGRSSQPADVEGPIAPPQLTLLNSTVEVVDRRGPRRGGLYAVNDWLNCRPDLELVATGGPVYRVTSEGRFESFWAGSATHLRWDGKYIWATPWKYISVLDENGREFVRYQESEVNSMKHSHMFQYAPAAPGELCMLGLVYLEPTGVRTWAGILRWEPGPNRSLIKRVEPFFEARLQAAARDPLMQSFTPMWGIDVPEGGPNGEPLFVLDHKRDLPLIIDMKNRSARLAKHPWPSGCRAVRDGKTIYMSPGSRGSSMDHAVYGVKKPDDEPQVVAEIHVADSGRLPDRYNSIVVFDGRLHLLARVAMQGNKEVYAWIAVDLSTKQAYVLADPLPQECCAYPRFVVSKHYGLVLLSQGLAFAATLPPVERWTPLSSRTLTYALTHPPATRPAMAFEIPDPTAPPGEESRLLRGHTAGVASVAFSPDSRRVASGGWFGDRSVTVWDVVSGKQLRVLQGHKGGIYAVAWSPDGRYLVSGGFHESGNGGVGELHLWDVEDGREVRSFTPTPGAVGALAFSPDGSRVLSGHSDGESRLWDVTTGKPLHTMSDRMDGVWAVAFSPDGRYMATAARGGDGYYVRLADAKNGQEIRKTARMSSRVQSLAFSPVDQTLLVAGRDGNACLINVVTGRKLRRFSPNHLGLRSIAFLPDAKHFVCGGGSSFAETATRVDWTSTQTSPQSPEQPDNDVLLWSLNTGKEVSRFRGHTLEVRSVAASPDGRWVASAGEDKTVRLWALPTTKKLQLLDNRPGGQANRLADADPPVGGVVTMRGFPWRLAAIVGLLILLVFLLLYRRLRSAAR